jgi:hypothetical protein
VSIAWFIAPYKQREKSRTPTRYCAMDDFTAQIAADGGAWAESEIDGNIAIVRVRASDDLLKKIAGGSDVEFKSVDNPTKEWTITRKQPAVRDGEIIFRSDKLVASLPLASVATMVPDDALWRDILREAEQIARQADRDGYVRIAKGAHTNHLLGVLGKWGYGQNKVSTGTFPSTGILDNFNRADENPITTATWTCVYEHFRVLSNQCEGTTSDWNKAYWKTKMTGADCEIYFTLTVFNTNCDDTNAEIFARQTEISDSPMYGYLTDLCGNASPASDTLHIYRTDGPPTQLGATISQNLAANDKVGCEIIGSTIKIFANLAGAGWSDISSGGRIDTTYPDAGYIGLTLHTVNYAKIDDLGGGTIAAAAAGIHIFSNPMDGLGTSFRGGMT